MMQTTRRTIAKAVTWQTLGLCVTTLIGFVLTGSIATGGTMAVLLSLIGAAFYVAHERIWERVGWGLGPEQEPSRRSRRIRRDRSVR